MENVLLSILNKRTVLSYCIMIGWMTANLSCSSSYQILPAKELPPVYVTVNHYEYGIENMDKEAKCDRNSLSAFYDGFVVRYTFSSNPSYRNTITFEIENKTEKSLIIDKSKCFVLYNGYSNELFKDIRTGKVTTFNDVQDAVSSVQTNESSVTMSIPPYSKWRLPIEETNVKQSSFPKTRKYEIGSYPQTVYTSEHTIEFVIPYSFDYKLAKWKTIRNRLFVDNIRVEKTLRDIPSDFYASRFTEGNEQVFEFLQDDDLKEWHAVKYYNLIGRVRNK